MSALKMYESGSRGLSIKQKMFKIQAGTDFTSFSTGIKIKVFRKMQNTYIFAKDAE